MFPVNPSAVYIWPSAINMEYCQLYSTTQQSYIYMGEYILEEKNVTFIYIYIYMLCSS